MNKLAQDLNINDKFYHNELWHWIVIEQPVIPVGTTIKVKAQYSYGSHGRIKTFNFGRLVSLDMYSK